MKYQHNQYGEATIVIRGTSNGQYVDDSFKVTVKYVDYPPVVANPIADVTVDENAEDVVIDLSNVFSDPDNDNSLMTYVALSANPALVVAAVSGQMLILDFQDDQFGSCDVTVTCESNGQTVADTFLVTVNEVKNNDFSLRVVPDGSGTAVADSYTGTYIGKEIKVQAEAMKGFQFVQWAATANVKITDATATQTTITVTDQGNVEVVAYFAMKAKGGILNVFSSPVDAGEVTPFGRTEVDADEIITLTAQPKDGYEFSSWCVNGNAEIADCQSAITTIKLFGSCQVFANFKRTDLPVQFSTVVSPLGAGKVTVPTDKKCNGQTIDVKALAEDGYTFIRWEVEGMAVVSKTFLPETPVVLKGNAVLKAIFAPTDEVSTVNLKITDAGGGVIGGIATSAIDSVKTGVRGTAAKTKDNKDLSIFHYKTIHLIKDEEFTISANSFANYLFVGWAAEGDLTIGNPYAMRTKIRANGDATLTAKFVEAYSGELLNKKSRVRISVNRKKDDRDLAVISNFSIPAEFTEFDPDTQSLTVFVDGQPFEVNNENGSFKKQKKKPKYRYKSNDKRVRLDLDFTKMLWKFRVSKTNLSQVDNIDGIDIILKVSDKYYGINMNIPERNRWAFNKKDISVPRKGVGDDISFNIDKLTAKYTSDKEKKNIVTIRISDLVISDKAKFNVETEQISLKIGGIKMLLPPDSMTTKRSGYLYKDKDAGIYSKLSLDKGKWSVKLKGKSAWFRIRSENNVNVEFMIGNAQGVRTLIVTNDKSTYKYKYPKKK